MIKPDGGFCSNFTHSTLNVYDKKKNFCIIESLGKKRRKGKREREGEREFSSTYPFVILESDASNKVTKKKMEKICKRNNICHFKSSRTLNRS